MRRYLSSRCDASTDRLRPTSYLIAIQNIGRLKSFVDDLDMEWGIVRMRVGLSYDLLRFSLLFRDLSGFSCLRPLPVGTSNLRPPPHTHHTHHTTHPHSHAHPRVYVSPPLSGLRRRTSSTYVRIRRIQYDTLPTTLPATRAWSSPVCIVYVYVHVRV